LKVVHPEFLSQSGIDGHVERAFLAHDYLLQHFIDASL
jgi:hypothetical protein